MHLFLQYQPNNHYISYTLVVVIFTCINYANWLVTIIVAVLSQHLLWHCHAIATASVAMLPCYRYCYRRCTSATSVAMLLLLIPLLRYHHLCVWFATATYLAMLPLSLLCFHRICCDAPLLPLLLPLLCFCRISCDTAMLPQLLPPLHFSHISCNATATAATTAVLPPPHLWQRYCCCYVISTIDAGDVANTLMLLLHGLWCCVLLVGIRRGALWKSISRMATVGAEQWRCGIIFNLVSKINAWKCIS